MITIAEVLSKHDKPFAWGCGTQGNDCCALMGSAVKARTGRDILRGFRGYTTRSGAAQKLRTQGAGTLWATLDTLLGDPIPVAFARPWDIVAISRGTVGVCCGAKTIYLSDNGLATMRTLAGKRAWRNG